MHKFEFKPDDLFVNRLKTYAEYNVFIYQAQMFNNRDINPGGIEVYDINANRTGTSKVYPFVMTGSTKNVFKKYKYQPIIKNATGEHFNIHKYWLEASGGLAENASVVANNGLVTSSYSSESPIKRNLTSRVSTISANYWNISSSALITGQVIALPNSTNLSASALQNVARKYTTLSNHFIFNSTPARLRDLVTGSAGDNINFITIPSMYYGSTIKKGSVELNYYITGSKIATCADTNHNGTLIGTTGSTSGSVVGLVLYDEGIIMLTSSVNLETGPALAIQYNQPIAAGVDRSRWTYFGTSLNDGRSHRTQATASYDLNFKGTNYVNSLTMFAHAKKGQLNHSNNPTYRDLSSQKINTTGSGLTFVEGTTPLANVVSASYVSASFEKTTYISKVNIYDEDGNLIAITSMARPIKKTLTDEFTFKMKLDL